MRVQDVKSRSDNGPYGGTWELLLPLDHVFPSSFALTLILMRGRDI